MKKSDWTIESRLVFFRNKEDRYTRQIGDSTRSRIFLWLTAGQEAQKNP